MSCPVFEVGDKVTCIFPDGYRGLTIGKKYTIRKYEPRSVEPSFTFPAYVQVAVEENTTLWCHASRFKL